MSDTYKPRHVMCVSVRLEEPMLTELVAETDKDSLSSIMNKKAIHALKGLIKKTHKGGDI